MKKILFILTLGGLLSCSNDKVENSTPQNPVVDTSTACRSITDSGPYSTFYKPATGFVGDPMPYYNKEDDTFYLYFLQDWRDGAPSDHPIYYTTTKDYASFLKFLEAIPYGTPDDQEHLLGTGSFIKDKDGKMYGFYTGHNGNLFPAEKIMLATSNDMKVFTKQPSFTFEAPDGYDKNNFRDPAVYFDPTKDCYVMLVTTLKDGKGVIARYTSNNLYDWELITPLTDLKSDAEIFECPEIFQMGDKWYLIFSRINRDEHRKTFYRIADSPDGPWKQATDKDGNIHETFDGLYLYAAKTAAKGSERYLSGWCSTGQQVNNHNELDWAGSLITHKLIQQSNGQLFPTIPEAVDNKFNDKVEFVDIDSQGDVIIGEDYYEIKATSKRSQIEFNRNNTPVKISMDIDASNSNSFGFSFGICDNSSEAYSIKFDLTSENSWSMPALFLNKEVGSYMNELNFTPLIVPTDKQFNIKLVIEKSVVVLYVNNNVAFTNRIYTMNQNLWSIFSDHGEIIISNMEINKVKN